MSINTLTQSRDLLAQQVAATEAQLRQLRAELELTEKKLTEEKARQAHEASNGVSPSSFPSPSSAPTYPLSLDEYRRYGRQMILPQIGLPGQLSLRESRVLIVGAGGLGSPAALYLAASGVGTLGLLDNDTVDVSNLHRQIIHTTTNARIDKSKVSSAIEACRALNPTVKYVGHETMLVAGEEAVGIMEGYDVVLDCTDNPATRYLVSDACVVAGKPLVSASALGTEGQLMVLNYPAHQPGDESGGPCYRCVFPKPPPANTVMKCAEGGVLGPVVGVMGVMQALEAIKVIVAMGREKQGLGKAEFTPRLHLFSGFSDAPMRSVRMRGRRKDCAACSANPTMTAETLRAGSMDYVLFCGSRNPVQILKEEERITPTEFRKMYGCSYGVKEMLGVSPVLIDTRDATQFGLCSLSPTYKVYNVPITRFSDAEAALREALPGEVTDETSTRPVVVMCRMGNDSQIAARRLLDMGLGREGKRWIGDLKGGLWGWRKEVDQGFPEY